MYCSINIDDLHRVPVLYVGCSALCWNSDVLGSYSWLWRSERVSFARKQSLSSLKTLSESFRALHNSEITIQLCTPVCHKMNQELATLYTISVVIQPKLLTDLSPSWDRLFPKFQKIWQSEYILRVGKF